jgi:hypothetical protein
MTSTSTGPSTKEERSAIVAKMKDFHFETMRRLTSKNIYFFPKVPYLGANGIKVIGMFKSELEKAGDDVFVELVNKNYESLDPKRTLYRFRHNPHFRQEYEMAQPNNERYNIPIDELEIVWKLPEIQAKEISIDTDNLDDSNIAQMTVRDLAAIMLKRPVSAKPWLNELIKSGG